MKKFYRLTARHQQGDKPLKAGDIVALGERQAAAFADKLIPLNDEEVKELDLDEDDLGDDIPDISNPDGEES
jgi:hypothetical protein